MLQGSQVLNAGKSDISPAKAKTAQLRLMGDVPEKFILYIYFFSVINTMCDGNA